jgi:hypothetical protein
MRWTGYAARSESGTYNISVREPQGNRPLKDLDVDGIISK